MQHPISSPQQAFGAKVSAGLFDPGTHLGDDLGDDLGDHLGEYLGDDLVLGQAS